MNNNTGAKSLHDLIDNKKFRIPMYQRNYKWNKEMAKKLVEDIVDCYKKNDEKVEKSLGLITLYKNENDIFDGFDVIDGQQRFTTIAILLGILDSKENIELYFERDGENFKRTNAVRKGDFEECTDVNRIKRNREAMMEVLQENYGNNIPKEELTEYVLHNVILLCSIVTVKPVDEFMNLNAYKTPFSISDHIRANLIVLNSFYRDELEQKDRPSILARCLSKHSYKTAVAILYNNIQKKLYAEEKEEGRYRSIYDLLSEPEIVIKPKMESNINILFGSMIKGNTQNYQSGEITEELDYWIKMLQKLAFVNKLLDELENEFEQGDFHSFKQIDDYQKLTKKSFIREIFDGIDDKWDSQTLAKEIQKYSNVDSVLIRYLAQDSKKLANRYLEAFVHSEVNSETYKQADNEINKKMTLPQMTMSEVIEEISGCGRYIINRYEIEHKDDLNICIDIPPVLDLEDRENVNFGSDLPELNDSDEISVGTIFKYDIKIPVIQRDYCMGAKITGKNDFLSFLLDGFNKYKNKREDKSEDRLVASTVLLSVSEENNKKALYIFDGQQRTFTLYNILQYCLDGSESSGDNKALGSYTFVGRCTEDNKKDNSYGSPYSEIAVNNLKEVLNRKLNNNEEKEKFAQYIKKEVFLKVKTVDNVSGAEQFFMDINGGIALEKYEIYKAMLCDKLSEIGKTDVVKKIENEWLDFFYRYRRDYMEVSNIQEKQEDEEELLEIRFLEYLIRFVYRMNHNGFKYEDIYYEDTINKNYLKGDNVQYEKFKKNNDRELNNEDILSFDEIESKGKMVDSLIYVSKLAEEDVDIVVKIMDSIILTEFECKDNAQVFEKSKPMMATNSSGGQIYFYEYGLMENKKSVLEKQGYYINKFIWSLSDGNRKRLKNYYRYKDISELRKIYDADQIMRDILFKIVGVEVLGNLGDTYPYQIPNKNIKWNIYAGYRNGSETDAEEKKVAIIKEIEIMEKELPAYYVKNIVYFDNIVRLQYLYEMSTNNQDILHFALIKGEGIKNKDGSGTHVCELKEGIPNTHVLINRTEAFCLRYIDDYL